MYGQDDWSVGQDDIYQPDLSDKPKKKMKSRFWAIVGSGLLFGLCAGDLGRRTVYAKVFRHWIR